MSEDTLFLKEDQVIFQVYNFYNKTSDFTFYKIKKELKKSVGSKNFKKIQEILKEYIDRKIAVGWKSGELVYIKIKESG